MKKPLLFLGADHAGFELKEKLKADLLHQGYEIYDLSPRFKKDDDYPIHAKKVALAVSKTPGSMGVLACGSGVGVSIAANRVKGARAFDAHDEKETKLAREHNDANVIALSGWKLSEKEALALVKTFLKTKASGAERHRRRVGQLG
ncbi:MAG: RpiB/LacA/LacB family sugar-phosphate isomerase [Patescibacteria group bacterium]|jgi:ribose 5-phosphate isomerase B